ncbi:Tetratricopeptide repeat-containing protein [Rickettsiales endosymbiont of Paramecium tredecaurelia]|uniref:hypothetical protein n=1 Tax=Candidatus Sarmatiella mevalonica TaxID=2770581 RepID=UPI001920DFB2|nr:hypothetical protein [Candidatus Sarmatiella mevalonica]MBL3284357.1 Tetratricopeptide repeat-containing protein [Candidatus Sarmatiella mevalonica]
MRQQNEQRELDALITRGQEHLQAEKYQNAISVFEHVWSKLEKSSVSIDRETKSDIYRDMGKAYFGLGEFKKAEQSFDNAIANSSSDSAAENAEIIAGACLEAGAPELAVVFFDYAIKYGKSDIQRLQMQHDHWQAPETKIFTQKYIRSRDDTSVKYYDRYAKGYKKIFDELSGANAKNINRYIKKSDALLKSNKVDRAAQALDKAQEALTIVKNALDQTEVDSLQDKINEAKNVMQAPRATQEIQSEYTKRKIAERELTEKASQNLKDLIKYNASSRVDENSRTYNFQSHRTLAQKDCGAVYDQNSGQQRANAMQQQFQEHTQRTQKNQPGELPPIDLQNKKQIKQSLQYLRPPGSRYDGESQNTGQDFQQEFKPIRLPIPEQLDKQNIARNQAKEMQNGLNQQSGQPRGSSAFKIKRYTEKQRGGIN